MKAFRVCALLSVLSIYALIVIGGYVTGAGLGLSAGREWPLPREGLLPTPENFVEYLHRAWSMATTLLVALTAAFSWKYRKRVGAKPTAAATLTLVVLVAQVLMGAIVLRSLATELHAVSVTAHLALATAVFGLATLTAVLANAAAGRELHPDRVVESRIRGR